MLTGCVVPFHSINVVNLFYVFSRLRQRFVRYLYSMARSSRVSRPVVIQSSKSLMEVAFESRHKVNVTIMTTKRQWLQSISPAMLFHVSIGFCSLFWRQELHSEQVIHQSKVLFPFLLFLIDVQFFQVMTYLIICFAILLHT